MSPASEAEHIGPSRGILRRRGWERGARTPERHTPLLAGDGEVAHGVEGDSAVGFAFGRDNHRGGGTLKGVPSRRGRRP